MIDSGPTGSRVSFEHALHGLQRVFEHDPRIDQAALPEGVDSLAVCTLVLNNLLNCLRTSNATSMPAFFWMLEQALYPKGKGDFCQLF